jgi:hypothetical protein
LLGLPRANMSNSIPAGFLVITAACAALFSAIAVVTSGLL